MAICDECSVSFMWSQSNRFCKQGGEPCDDVNIATFYYSLYIMNWMIHLEDGNSNW